MSPRTLRRAAAAAALATLLTTPPPATAGEYPVRACAVPGAESASQGPWMPYDVGDPSFLGMPVTTCAAHGHFGRHDATSPFNSYPLYDGFAGFRAVVPASKDIELRGLQVRGTIGYSKPGDSLGSLRTTAMPGDFMVCGGALSQCDSTWSLTFADGTREATLGVMCFSGGTCKTGNTYRQEWKWAVLTAAEDEAPSPGPVGGPLMNGRGQDGVRNLTYTAADGESGVARVVARLGGVVVGEDDATGDPARCGYHDWAACPVAAVGAVPVDTRLVPDGEQPLRITVTDAAGNVAEETAGTVLVDNVKAPEATRAPRVTGTAAVGEVLAGDPGAFANATNDAPATRFLRCDGPTCTPIDGATSTAYRLTDADLGKQIAFTSTAVNAIGEATTATSARTATVTAKPAAPGPGTNPDPNPNAKPGATDAEKGAKAAGAGAPNGTNASPNARLVVKLTDDRTTRRVAYGKPATIRGTLADETGKPVAGATVSVTTRVRRAGAKPAARKPLTTNARGEFVLTVAKGPSRELTFGYRAYTADTDLTATKSVTLLVASKLKLTATPRRLRNGKRVRFTGMVKGKPTGRHGPLVDLQVLVDGRWRSFLKGAVRADRQGRFKASYRFLRTTRPTTYRFRAVARQDAAYPYTANHSPRITVRVRP